MSWLVSTLETLFFFFKRLRKLRLYPADIFGGGICVCVAPLSMSGRDQRQARKCIMTSKQS